MKTFCCMRLNTAAVVIGWVGAAASFISSILLIFALVNVDELAKGIIDNMTNSDTKAADIRSMLIIVIAIQLAINVINLTASALLVAGTIKERHLMLMPWLINSGISLAFYAISGIIILTSAIGSNAGFGSVLNSFSVVGLSFGIQFYIWSAIYSHYKELQANRERQRLLQQPQNSPSYSKI